MMSDAKKMQRLFKQSLPLFNALGHPIRQQLMLLMMEGRRKSVAELTAHTALSRPTVSHHLKILWDAHILAKTKEGRKTYYYPQMGDYFDPIKELVETVVAITNQKGKTK